MCRALGKVQLPEIETRPEPLNGSYRLLTIERLAHRHGSRINPVSEVHSQI